MLKVTPETQDLQGQKEIQEIQEQLVKLVQKEIQEIQVQQVQPEPKVTLEIQEQQAIVVQKETLEMMVKVLMYTKTMLTDR